MAKIRDLISQPTKLNEKVVEFKGDRYLLQGSPDANLYSESITLSPEKVDIYARHWTQTCGQLIKPEIVKNVKMVHITLQSVEWNKESKEWMPMETPFDETEIAALAYKEGLLFLQLTSAAYEVLGITEEDSFEQVAAKNSEEEDSSEDTN